MANRPPPSRICFDHSIPRIQSPLRSRQRHDHSRLDSSVVQLLPIRVDCGGWSQYCHQFDRTWSHCGQDQQAANCHRQVPGNPGGGEGEQLEDFERGCK